MQTILLKDFRYSCLYRWSNMSRSDGHPERKDTYQNVFSSARFGILCTKRCTQVQTRFNCRELFLRSICMRGREEHPWLKSHLQHREGAESCAISARFWLSSTSSEVTICRRFTPKDQNSKGPMPNAGGRLREWVLTEKWCHADWGAGDHMEGKFSYHAAAAAQETRIWNLLVEQMKIMNQDKAPRDAVNERTGRTRSFYPVPLDLLSMNPLIFAWPSKVPKKHLLVVFSHTTTSNCLA